MKLRNNDISPPLSNFSAPLASPSPAPSPSPSLPPPPPLVEDDYDPFASDDEEEVRGREDKEVHLAHWEQHTNGFGSRMLLKLFAISFSFFSFSFFFFSLNYLLTKLNFSFSEGTKKEKE